jgi:hypothetical protein
LRCLVEAIKRIDQESKQYPKELIIGIQVVSHIECSHASNEEMKKQANHNKS